MTITRAITFSRRSDGTKAIEVDAARPLPPGRVPRVARLMALAIHLDGSLERGEFASRQELARLLHITQPRLTQILNLNYLAPDIQTALLELPRSVRGRDPIHERMLRPIVALTSWRAQRAAWRALAADRSN